MIDVTVKCVIIYDIDFKVFLSFYNLLQIWFPETEKRETSWEAIVEDCVKQDSAGNHKNCKTNPKKSKN